jgi:hypothetical protein
MNGWCVSGCSETICNVGQGCVVAYPLVSNILSSVAAADGTVTLIGRRRGLVPSLACLAGDVMIVPRMLLSKRECDNAWLPRRRYDDVHLDLSTGSADIAAPAVMVQSMNGMEEKLMAVEQTVKFLVRVNRQRTGTTTVSFASAQLRRDDE